MSESTTMETIRRAGSIAVDDRVQWRVAGTWDKERRDWQWRHGVVLSIFRHHPGEGLAAMVQPDDDEHTHAFHLSSLQKESSMTETATCTATLTDRETVITCERQLHQDDNHMAEFFGAVYIWQTGAPDYRVRSILGDESTVPVTREVMAP